MKTCSEREAREQALAAFLTSSQIYGPSDLPMVLKQVRPQFRIVRRKQRLYFDVPCAFDIEATSWEDETGKHATMWVWSFCLFGLVIVGRSWQEFAEMLDNLSAELELNENKRLIIFVHNLQYDFSFFRKWFAWASVFAIDNRRPLYAVTDTWLEFRCSYLLSGLSLDTVSKHLQRLHVRKMVGDLDYSLIRNSKTAITSKEMHYIINDVKVVVAYVWESATESGHIGLLPLTNTGYVRNYCRGCCFKVPGDKKASNRKRQKYKSLMQGLTLDSDSYKQCKRAFQGGFTHGNPWYIGEILRDVTSFDFTSSYPTVMIAEQFPMSSPEKVELSDLSKDRFEELITLYCCVFELELWGVKPLVTFENYLSVSHCREVEKAICSNGRIIQADHLITTITEIDYKIITKFYSWEKARVYHMYTFKRDYLPSDFVRSIIDLYEKKTVLKGIEGSETEYMRSKGMLNSTYGMTVTNIVRDPITYLDNLWPGEGEREDEAPERANIEQSIEQYNKDKGRFLYYPWGIYVTAYARRNLFLGILEFRHDYIYADTDSVKVLHAAEHMDFINSYNQAIIERLEAACKYHHIAPEAIRPKNQKGKECPLGVWAFDGHYRMFKTLGAKRYLVQYSNDPRNDHPYKNALTVAGLGKVAGCSYLEKTYGKYGMFKAFREDLYIPKGETGKQIHSYIDAAETGQLTDYNGIVSEFAERSSVNLSPSDYYLSMTEELRSHIYSTWDFNY